MLNCTPIEYCMGNISGLSDSELLQVATAIKKRTKRTRKQEKTRTYKQSGCCIA